MQSSATFNDTAYRTRKAGHAHCGLMPPYFNWILLLSWPRVVASRWLDKRHGALTTTPVKPILQYRTPTRNG